MKTDLSMYQVTVRSISCRCCVDLDMQPWAWIWRSCLLGQEPRCSSNDWGWVSHPSLAHEVWASGPWAEGCWAAFPSAQLCLEVALGHTGKPSLERTRESNLRRLDFIRVWEYFTPMIWIKKQVRIFLLCKVGKIGKKMLSKSFHVNQSVGQCPVGRWGL